jgi:hypothetical protein
MADYFDQTVIQQIIPDGDITPIEHLLLSQIFECEPTDDGWYFFAENGPSSMVYATRPEIEEALAASTDKQCTAYVFVAERLAALNAEPGEIELDVSDTSWEFFFQDIVGRSTELRYITAVTAFTCTKMRPDGFGGMAVLITADAIMGKSTNDLIEDFIAEAGLDDSDRASVGTFSDGGAQ